VATERRRKRIGTALARQGLASLRAAGMDIAETYSFDNSAPRGFLGSLDFRIVRRFSRMRGSLASVPGGVGEARNVEVVTLGRTDEDIGLMCRIRNEAFKEHFNYSPETLDNWKFAVKNWDKRASRTSPSRGSRANRQAIYPTASIPRRTRI